MFGLFTLAPTKSRRRQHRIALWLEDLEGRAHPDGGVGDPPTPPYETGTNQPPQIVDFNAEQVSNGVFVISGHVVDENPAGLIVTLGGSTSASGIQIVCDSNGDFYATIRLKTDGTDSGTITAKTVDDHNQQSPE